MVYRHVCTLITSNQRSELIMLINVGIEENIYYIIDLAKCDLVFFYVSNNLYIAVKCCIFFKRKIIAKKYL